MKTIRLRRLWPLGVAAVFAFVLLFAVGSRGAEQGSKYALTAPSFVGVASAAADNQILEDIQDEAGISAYVDTESTIVLAQVRDSFRTIEIETSDYIVGSIEITGYPETEDVHVYIHRDGWLMAYYLNTDPVAKIIDWTAYIASGYVNIPTKLETTLSLVAGIAGVPLPPVSHYDFRYPNATKMMFIVERDNTSEVDLFTINLPSSFGFSERSYSVYDTNGGNWGCATFILNGSQILDTCGQGYGSLTGAQLPANSTHSLSIDGTGILGLSLVYRE